MRKLCHIICIRIYILKALNDILPKSLDLRLKLLNIRCLGLLYMLNLVQRLGKNPNQCYKVSLLLAIYHFLELLDDDFVELSLSAEDLFFLDDLMVGLDLLLELGQTPL